MRSGDCFERPTLVPLTIATGGSRSRGEAKLSTPDTMPEAPLSGANRKKAPGSRPVGLGNQIQHLTSDEDEDEAPTMLPTPNARDWKGPPRNPEARGRTTGQLDEAIEVLLPRMTTPVLMTPTAEEGTKPSNTMGVERRRSTGQVFLTNQIVTLEGLDPTEG
jgi:hypothetical protein